MGVTGKDFIEFAGKCIAHNDEIGYRNAVGRAYYGVYHETCCKLEKCPNKDSHVGVRDYLTRDSWLKGNEPFDKMKLIAMGAFLKQLHTRRKWADYELERTFSKADAEAILIMARNAMDKLQAMHEEVYPSQPAA